MTITLVLSCNNNNCTNHDYGGVYIDDVANNNNSNNAIARPSLPNSFGSCNQCALRIEFQNHPSTLPREPGMSSRYTSTSTVNRNFSDYNNVNGNADNQLDELLEDLQMSVSPRAVNHDQMVNGGTPSRTGYREVIKSSSRSETIGGKPVESTREYHVEYLNPSNSTSVIQERSISPYYNNNSNDVPGRSSANSYKTVSYKYNTARTGNSEVIPSTTTYDNKETSRNTSDVKFKQNINELDSLLDDLNQTQNATFHQPGSNNYQLRTMDNSFPPPADFSTPQHATQKNQRVERIEQRTYEEQRYGTVNPSPIRTTEVKKEVFYNSDPGNTSTLRYEERSPSRASTSSEVKKDLLYTGGSTRYREPSPARQIQEVYRYETKTTSRKGTEIPTTPVQKANTVRNYYETDVTDHNAVPFVVNERQTNSYNTYRSPTPTRNNVGNYSNNAYVRENTVRENTIRRSPSPSPSRYYNTTSTTSGITNERENFVPTSPPPPKTSYSTVSRTTTQETSNRRDVTANKSQPYRSPSPASFPQPPDSPEPTLKTYSFERNNVAKPVSPLPTQKFSPSDPSSREPQQVGKTIITKNYTYSSHHQGGPTERYPPYNGYPPEDQYNRYQPQSPPNYRSPPDQNRYPSDHGRQYPTTQTTTHTVYMEQKPPKQLDELMASFSDTEITNSRYAHSPTKDHLTIGTKSTPPATPVETTLIPTPIEKIPEKLKVTEMTKEKTANGLAGPPVYYPPGPLFVKNEESAAMMEQSYAGGKGKMKASRKAKYQYESESKMRESSTTKKTVVPLCLPVCCALPCTIM